MSSAHLPNPFIRCYIPVFILVRFIYEKLFSSPPLPQLLGRPSPALPVPNFNVAVCEIFKIENGDKRGRNLSLSFFTRHSPFGISRLRERKTTCLSHSEKVPLDNGLFFPPNLK